MPTSELIKMREVEKIARGLVAEDNATEGGIKPNSPKLSDGLDELLRLAQGIDKLPAKARKDRLTELQDHILDIKAEMQKYNHKPQLDSMTTQLTDISKKLDILLTSTVPSQMPQPQPQQQAAAPQPAATHKPPGKSMPPEQKILVVCVIAAIIVIIATTFH